MRIALTADLHLGCVQYGLKQREQDFYDAASFVFKRADELNADMLVLAGDLFDAVKPPAKAVKFLSHYVKVIRGLCTVDVVGIDGNHDGTDNGWLNVCDIKALSRTPMEYKGIKIIGLNSMRPALFYNELNSLTEKADVLVIHQSVLELANAPFAEISATEMLPKLKELGIRCVLMGDIHDASDRIIGGVQFIYPGSPEVTAINERRDKVFYVVDIDDKQVKLQVEPVRTRPIVELQISTQADIDKLLAELDRLPGALTVLWYSSTVEGLRIKLEDLLSGRNVAYILRPLTESGELLNDMNKEHTFDKRGIMARQVEAIKEYFEETSDAYQLVSQLLLNPNNVDIIFNDYLKSKGLA